MRLLVVRIALGPFHLLESIPALRGGRVAMVARSAAAVLLLLSFSACEVRAPHDGTAEPVSLETGIARALDALSARSSLHAKHLPTGREIEIRADEPMNTLSVIKIPIMVLAYRDAESSKLDLDERYTIRPEDRRRGSGLLQTFAPGLSPTYRDLVTQMIVTSDNSATDLLIARLGLDRVNSLLQEEGYQKTSLRRTTGELFRRVWELEDPRNSALSPAEVFDRGFPSDEGAFERSFLFEGDPKEWLGSTTARETSRLLEQIYAGEIASRASCDEMIEILRQQFYSSRLPRFLPDGVEAAHKTGDWPPIAGNDVGILYHPGGPTIVSIYVNQNRTDFNEVEETHGEIARMLVEAWGTN
jgi:beta-lactamase class A